MISVNNVRVESNEMAIQQLLELACLDPQLPQVFLQVQEYECTHSQSALHSHRYGN